MARKATPAVILDQAAFTEMLQKYVVTETTEGGNRSTRKLNAEGERLVEERQNAIRAAWHPDDISEADQWPEPLRTVVSFRLLVSQYVGLCGDSMNELPNYWKRDRLLGLFSPMVDDVAAALLDKNEDPKELFRVMPLANERDQTKFADKWRGEVLPTLRALELKLRSRPTATTGGARTKGKGGRNRITKRTPVESKVMKYWKANSHLASYEIDADLRLQSGEAKRIYQRVTRRECRNKPKSADEIGQN